MNLSNLSLCTLNFSGISGIFGDDIWNNVKVGSKELLNQKILIKCFDRSKTVNQLLLFFLNLKNVQHFKCLAPIAYTHWSTIKFVWNCNFLLAKQKHHYTNGQ